MTSTQTVVLDLPLSDAQAPMWSAAQNKFVPGTLGTPGGWQTFMNVDLTAIGSQSLGSDGAHVISGFSWTKENSANDRSPMVITGGTGLVIQPATGTNYDGFTVRTSPLLYLPLSQLNIPNLSWSAQFRLWLQSSGETRTGPGLSNDDETFIGIDNNSTSYTVGVGFYGGTPAGNRIIRAMVRGGNVQGIQPGTFLSIPVASFMTEVSMNGLAAERMESRSFFNQTGTAWPAEAAIHPIVGEFASAVDLQASPTNASTGLGIVLGAFQTGNDSYVTTITNIRIDCKL
jgi:hypothetical protein